MRIVIGGPEDRSIFLDTLVSILAENGLIEEDFKHKSLEGKYQFETAPSDMGLLLKYSQDAYLDFWEGRTLNEPLLERKHGFDVQRRIRNNTYHLVGFGVREDGFSMSDLTIHRSNFHSPEIDVAKQLEKFKSGDPYMPVLKLMVELYSKSKAENVQPWPVGEII